MAKNDFKAFATDRSANVISQEEWEALPALLSGFTAGKASSAQVNKVIRQASFIAAALAQFVSDKTQRDVLDNGDLPGFVELLGSGFAVEYLSRKNPFGDIKSDGTVQTALENLDLGNLVDALIKTNNLSDLPDKAVSRTNLVVPKGIDKQMCNEWCVFNGVTTITIGDSLGISSVTRTGVGQYTVNLSTPYPSTNYAIIGSWSSTQVDRDHELSVRNKTANSFQLFCAHDSSDSYPPTDAFELSLAIWGVR